MPSSVAAKLMAFLSEGGKGALRAVQALVVGLKL
jgi:hypothetical protein